jgi:LPS-assembly lipoprotein
MWWFNAWHWLQKNEPMNRLSFLRPCSGFWRLSLLLTLMSLSACGFHLRGVPVQTQGESASTPVLAGQTVWLSASAQSPLGLQLRRLLQGMAGARVVDESQAAQVRLEILGEQREKSVIATNASGQVRELQLRYRLRFRVRNRDGQEVIEETEMTLSRDLSYNEAQALAKESEERLLYENMQSDMAQQLLRRLMAAPGLQTP